MPNFRRYYVPNAIVFITTITDQRAPIFNSEDNIRLFWHTLQMVREVHPFRLLAYVILPDHFHWLMRVEGADGNFSAVLHSVKRNYTINYKQAHGITSRLKLWQERFWDHVIRDECDLRNHFDYIHWNPVKHGYVQRPEDWAHSSYGFWFKRGYYELGWGHLDEPAHLIGMDLE